MDDSTKEEKEKVQHNLKAKTSLLPLLVLMSFFSVSHCETAKEMRDTLQNTHEGTYEVQNARMNTLTHECNLLIIKF